MAENGFRPLYFILLVPVFLLIAYFLWPSSTPKPLVPQKDSSLLVEIAPEEIFKRIQSAPPKVRLLNIWASWCGPCRQEIPDLIRLRNDLDPEAFELILYSADHLEDKGEALLALEELKVNFLTYMKGDASLQSLETLLPSWQGVLPVSILYSPSGEILQTWRGTTSYSEFKSSIQKALANAGGV